MHHAKQIILFVCSPGCIHVLPQSLLVKWNPLETRCNLKKTLLLHSLEHFSVGHNLIMSVCFLACLFFCFRQSLPRQPNWPQTH